MSMVSRQQLSDVLRSAVEASLDPAMASANWLARDIDPNYNTAVELLTDSTVSLETLHKAKDVYKTMRILGESSTDRRVAARLYAAAIGAVVGCVLSVMWNVTHFIFIGIVVMRASWFD